MISDDPAGPVGSAADSARLPRDPANATPAPSAQAQAIARRIAAIEREIAKVDLKAGVAQDRQEEADTLALTRHRETLEEHRRVLERLMTTVEP